MIPQPFVISIMQLKLINFLITLTFSDLIFAFSFSNIQKIYQIR